MAGSVRNTTHQRGKILVAVLWGLVFAISYAQSPLYTSNQNQYFLHGLARAGYGDLNQDWLANTSDPTPFFSGLVESTYRYLRWEGLFYVYYAVLMGIYLFSLWGIVNTVYDLRSSPEKCLLFLGLLVFLHSAGLRFVLSHVVGVNWTYIFEDGVADQRLLGPVLQPSVFGVFLLLSIYLFLKGKSVLAILAVAAAATIHPTYLLSAGTLTAAYLLLIFVNERDIRKVLVLGGLALLAIAPTLLAAVQVFAGGGQATEQARQILIEFRIPHHAQVGWWLDATALVKILITILALYVIRRTQLFYILLICAITALGLTLAQIALQSSALALLFPWRLSTFIVPLSSAIILAYLVDGLLSRPLFSSQNSLKAVRAASITFIVLAVFAGVVRFALDLERSASYPERGVEAYVAANREPGEKYLTPIKMQDFRIAAGAPVFIDFKSIPYRADEVLEWYRRVQMADRFYKTGDCAVLGLILGEYPLTHVVMETGPQKHLCPQLQLVYHDEAYELYQVR